MVHFTGVDAVDTEIIKMIQESNDLTALYDNGFYWSDADENTKKAIARIYEVDIDYIDGHLSNRKCSEQEARVGTILKLVSNGKVSEGTTVFNTEYIRELKSYVTSETALNYLEQLEPLQKENYDYNATESVVKVSINGVGIVFRVENTGDKGGDEILCYTSEDRTRKCIKYWESKNPDCFKHEYSLLDENKSEEEKREMLVTFYCTAQTSADVTIIDSLLKDDGTYKNVFCNNPTDLSDGGKYVLGVHANRLAQLYVSSNQNNEEFFNFATAALNENQKYVEEYTEALSVGSSLVADYYIGLAWSMDYASCSKAEQDELASVMEIANHNELFWTGMYNFCSENELQGPLEFTSTSDFDFLDGEVVSLSYQVKPQNNHMYGWFDDGNRSATISFDESIGLVAVNDICDSRIHNLQVAKVDAVMNGIAMLPIDCLCAYDPVVGNVVKSMAYHLSDEDKKAIAAEASIYGYKNKTFTSNVEVVGVKALLKVVEDLQKKDSQIEEFEEIQQATMFYTCMSYGNNKYYLKINDYNVIKAMRTWEAEGVKAIYPDNDKYCKDFGYIIDRPKEVKIICNSISGYSDVEVECALKLIVNGIDAVGEDDIYKSFRDIPGDLFIKCVRALDKHHLNGDDIENTFLVYLKSESYMEEKAE